MRQPALPRRVGACGRTRLCTAAVDFDLILAGGGLANGLIALRLAQTRPDLKVAIVEAAPTLGGDHTWSSFAADISTRARDWTAPLFAHRWDEYSIRFPGHARTLPQGYGSATSARLDSALREALPEGRIITGVAVAALDPDGVTLADQRRLSARGVIDGRGQRRTPHLDLRWQKFLGVELELARPHGLPGPIIMDATIPQTDGYRFVYTLPFSPTHVLVEDTYYADGPDLTPDLLRRHILDYAAAQGWDVTAAGREEHGILPLALGGDIEAFWREDDAGVARSGLGAALFHPVTGYSFPDAVAAADMVAALPAQDSATLRRAMRDHSVKTWKARGLYRMLNRMLFLAAKDEERRHILERFYRLDGDLVARFYAAQNTLYDWAQILTGTPPIPIPRAVKTLLRYELETHA
jgi:lycopene beta-cyclase